MVNELRIEVRSTELDTLGHVNNAKYQEYLEWGRFEWVKRSGLPVDALGREGFATVIVNVNINYRREARLGEKLTIRTWLSGLGNSSLRIGQEVRNERGDVVCDAAVTSATFDTATRRSVPIPEEIRAMLEERVVAAEGTG